MRIVSEQSDKDIALSQAEAAIGYALRKMAANLMRISRGAGKPHSIVQDADDLLVAVERYKSHAPLGVPTSVVSNALDLINTFEPELSEIDDAENVMVSGALQLAASTLLDQNLQITAGRRELLRGHRYRTEAIKNTKKRSAPKSSAKNKPEKW